MEPVAIILVVESVVLATLALALLWALSRRPRAGENVEEQLQRFQEVMQAQMQGVRDTVSASLGNVQDNVRSQIDLMASVRQGLGELTETARTMKDLGKDILTLEDLLKPPKFRGEIGEFLLERLLEQVLPRGSFALQHGFRDGKVVDAAIFLHGKIVPVDSKFPLEGFTRILEARSEEESRRCRREFAHTIRGHIDAVAQYIRPSEGTLEFSMMYVPAENVYYELLTWRQDEDVDLCSYALSRKVIPVSPNSFYLYLQSIAIGLRGLQLEQSVEEVWKTLSALSLRVDRLIDQELRVLGRHLKNAQDKYDETRRGLEQFGNELRLARQVSHREASRSIASPNALEGNDGPEKEVTR